MNLESKFFQRSLRVAERFLQTAVVIDDRAFREEMVLEPPPEALVSPPTPSSAPLSDAVLFEPSLPAAEPSPVTIQIEDPDPHGLDAEAVIKSFAELGIICSVLRRVPDENPADPGHSARLLLAPADILIIDWQIHRADGSNTPEETLKFLETAVTVSATESPEQLRVILIYTGALDLLSVVEQAEARLKAVNGLNVQKDGDFAFRIGSAKVVVLGKPSRYRPPQSREQQVGSDADLAGWATREFTTMTTGLVSNVILQGLSEVRRATHRILSRFGPNLDAPFLAHRALIHPPEEANEHLLPLLSSEIQAILEAALLTAEPSDEAIEEWLAERIQERVDARGDRIEEVGLSVFHLLYLAQFGVERCMREGLANELSLLGEWNAAGKHAKLDEGVVDRLADLFQGREIPGAQARFAELMAVRPRYGDAPPMLTLGTVLERQETKQQEGKKPVIKSTYWLCLQPVCDCVRLSESRSFPLMPLGKKQSGWFSLCLFVDGTLIRLRIDPRPHEIQMVPFAPSTVSKTVVATRAQDQWWFGNVAANPKWRWLGELKFEHAQRAVQAFANQNSRIGLTESEWQRRRASH